MQVSIQISMVDYLQITTNNSSCLCRHMTVPPIKMESPFPLYLNLTWLSDLF